MGGRRAVTTGSPTEMPADWMSAREVLVVSCWLSRRRSRLNDEGRTWRSWTRDTMLARPAAGAWGPPNQEVRAVAFVSTARVAAIAARACGGVSVCERESECGRTETMVLTVCA